MLGLTFFDMLLDLLAGGVTLPLISVTFFNIPVFKRVTF